jgi:hypothetical protein
VFTGRDDLVRKGVEFLCTNKPAFLAILGPGGIGKTSLALHISRAKDVQGRFKDRCYFLPCDILPDATALVEGMLQVLRLQLQEGWGQFDILYRYLKASTDDLLFILDNLETPWNHEGARTSVGNLIGKLADIPNLSLIVTMRGLNGPGDIPWFKLGSDSGVPTLSVDAAREAFLAIAGKEYISDKDYKSLDELLSKELECVPLAIRLTAQHAKKIPLESLIRSWNEKKTSMLQEFGAKPDRLTSVDYSINLSIRLVDQKSLELLSIV